MRFEQTKNICWIEASFLNHGELRLTGDLQIRYRILSKGDECCGGEVIDKYFEIENVIWHRDKLFGSAIHCHGDITNALTDIEYNELEEKINEGNVHAF